MRDVNKNLENLIRKVLLEVLQENGGHNTKKNKDKSGVISFHTPDWTPEPFDTGHFGDKVFVKDMVSLEESPRLGFGVMEMDQTTFEWHLKYDEVDYIIDGTLEIIIEGRKVVGNPGDVIFIPANSTIKFSVPKFARFLYVAYPANWAEL